MATFRKLPLEVEAVQFTGSNWAEMHAFTGHRIPGDQAGRENPVQIDVFTEMGTFLLDYVDEHVNCPAELWVEANKAVLPIGIGEWVIKDRIGFYPCKEEIFQDSYVDIEEYDALTGYDTSTPLQLTEADSDARVIGRVRMALMLTRPEAEMDLICEKIVAWRTTHEAFRIVRKEVSDDPDRP